MASPKRARPKAVVCPRSSHADAPHGPKGPCPHCGRARCHGRSTTNPGRCHAFPRKGATVCGSHGAAAPQVKAAAARRVEVAAQERAAARWAEPVETTAADAMREVLWARKGLRDHYARQLGKTRALETSPAEWDETVKALVVLYDRAERDYFLTAAECRRANIDEARFELEAGAFEMVDRLLNGVFRRAGLDPNAPEIAEHVAAELRLIAGGAV